MWLYYKRYQVVILHKSGSEARPWKCIGEEPTRKSDPTDASASMPEESVFSLLLTPLAWPSFDARPTAALPSSVDQSKSPMLFA